MNPALKKRIRQLLPRGQSPHRILAGPLRNYRIVTSWHDYPAAILGYTERQLLEWLAQNIKPGETWLDVGAHYGYTAIAMALGVGSAGRVFAFEPMLTSAGCLAQTRRLNGLAQLTVLPLALGDADALSLERLPVVRGMVESLGMGNSGGMPQVQETLLVEALDELWHRICGTDPHMDGIKIDVQGMELAVLRGMKSVLQAHQPKLVVELHEGVSRGDLMSLIRAAGYSQAAIAIEPEPNETAPLFLNDKSYAFLAGG